MVGLLVLVFILVSFFLLSGAIVYHLWRYSPQKKQAAVLIILYITVSLILVSFFLFSFNRINWSGN